MRGRYVLGKTDYRVKGRRDCEAAITWELEDGRLSMQAEVWQADKRDIYMGGQCVDEVAAMFPHDAKAARMVEVWRRWHLNDMKAGCEHQREVDVGEMVEVVSYKLTSEALGVRKDATQRAAQAAVEGKVCELTPQERALLALERWFADVYVLPDADSPLAGCYQVSKREQKAIGWLHPHEHPRGMLTRACEVCGYEYGTKWLREELPPEVVKEVEGWTCKASAAATS